MCEWQNGSCCGEDSQECTQCSIRCILRQEIQPQENTLARVSMSTDEGHGTTTPSPRLKPFATPPGGQLAAVPEPSPVPSAPSSSPRQVEAPTRTTPSPPSSPSKPRDKRQRTQDDLEAEKPAGDPDVAAGQKRSNPSSRAASPWLASSDGGGAPDPPTSNGPATFKAPHFSVRQLSVPSPLPPPTPSDPSAPVKICAVCDGPGKHEDPRYDAWRSTCCSICLFHLP